MTFQSPEVVFWEGALSIHRAPLIRALANDLGRRVMVVAESDVPPRRRNMGWPEPDYGDAEVVLAPTDRVRQIVVQETRKASAHVFSGLGSNRATTRTMVDLARGEHNHICVCSESWDPRDIEGKVRRFVYSFRARKYRDAIDSVLSIGPLARAQFTSIGFRDDQVYPFSYFVEEPSDVLESGPRNEIFEMIYVGQLIDRKNVELLLEAFHSIPKNCVRLRIVGGGSERDRLSKCCERLQITDHVTFVDNLANSEIQELLSRCDLLILPSKYDGWGAVVNESLSLGTRVCVSEGAGSYDLVISPLQGWTFESGSLSGLAASLTKAIDQGKIRRSQRSELIAWARTAISPSVGAEYLWKILSGVAGSSLRSGPPWDPELRSTRGT